jgi:hypothetical protein
MVGRVWDVSWGGYWTVDPKTGRGDWPDGPQRNHSYVLERMDVAAVQQLIENELFRSPARETERDGKGR